MSANEITRTRVVENGRLAFYSTSSATAGHWDELWSECLDTELYAYARTGGLSYFEKVFTRWLPKNGRIIEAGCGRGQFVLALKTRGYDVEGVDYATETVEKVKEMQPDLPISRADVTKLDVPDGHYTAYISLGVVEHRREGPEPFLREAHRVLADDGVAMISVPYFNVLRRSLARLGCYNTEQYGEFYQFAFSEAELTQLLCKEGFTVVGRCRYDAVNCINEELPRLGKVLRKIFSVRGLGWRLEHLLWYGPCSHMLMLVCKKNKQSPKNA